VYPARARVVFRRVVFACMPVRQPTRLLRVFRFAQHYAWRSLNVEGKYQVSCQARQRRRRAARRPSCLPVHVVCVRRMFAKPAKEQVKRAPSMHHKWFSERFHTAK